MAQIVLVHSPLVGASTWRPIAERFRGNAFDVVVPSLAGTAGASPPRWRHAVDRILTAVGGGGDVVLVGHSGAGPLLPAVTAALGDAVKSIVFVDAPVPPERGTTGPAPAEFRAFLEGLAREDGTLPPWSQWWGDRAMERLVPDAALRAELEADMETLPLTYFDEVIPVATEWCDRRVAYIQLSAAYADDAAIAVGRGWPVDRIDGQHLDLVTRPNVVAPLIERYLPPDTA